MTKNTSLLSLLYIVVLATTLAAPAQAQNGTLTRSFVSSTGVDTNACTIAAPCATFAHAYTAIGANGIIAALDPGKYGPITITGSVTINGNGWSAITGPANGNAITINAGSGDVTLTGLDLDGAQAATNGIDFTGSGTLHIENSAIRNFSNDGILMYPSAAVQVFFIGYVALTDNQNTGLLILLAITSACALDHIRATNNSYGGFSTIASGSISISNSVFANSPDGCGIYVQGGSVIVSDSIVQNNSQGICTDAASAVTVRSSEVAGSSVGIIATNGGIAWVTRSTINGNSTGISVPSGTVYSYGDNNLFNNTTEGSFQSPTLSYK